MIKFFSFKTTSRNLIIIMFKTIILIAFSSIVPGDHAIVPKIRLSDGNEIPVVGYGTFEISNPQNFLDAIDNGYRHIDTAYVYGNEKQIGSALKEAFATHRVKREDLFIVTKIWCTYHRKAVENLRTELSYLGLNYTDLALVHHPTGFREGTDDFPKFPNGSFIPNYWQKDRSYLEAYQGLEEAKELGLTRSIGVANMNIHQLKVILEKAKVKPVINQFENHPLFNQEKLVKFCQSNNVTVTGYSPIRRATPELMNEPVLKEIAQKHNKTVPQVSLRFNIQRGLVVIPRSQRKDRQAENINIFDFTLSESEMKQICEIKQRPKLIDMPGIEHNPDYSFGPELL